MWVLLQLLCSACVVFIRIFCREYGLTLHTFLGCLVIYACILSWAVPLAFEKAPSFFHAYFLSIVSLALVGFLFSIFYFRDQVSVLGYTGASLALIGSVLICLK